MSFRFQGRILRHRAHAAAERIRVKAGQAQRAHDLAGGLAGIAGDHNPPLPGQLVQKLHNLDKGDVDGAFQVALGVVFGAADIQNQRISRFRNLQRLFQRNHVFAVCFFKIGFGRLKSGFRRLHGQRHSGNSRQHRRGQQQRNQFFHSGMLLFYRAFC